VFAKSVFEPIEDGGELNKSKKGDGQFVIASAQTPVTFDSAEVIFNAMAPVIEPATEGPSPRAVLAARNASFPSETAYAFTQMIGVEPFVTDQSSASKQAKMRFNRMDLAALPWLKAQRNSVAVTVDQRGELCIEASFGETDPLGKLATSGIGAVLVELDVGRVDKTCCAPSSLRQDRQHLRPQAARNPSAPPTVHARPICKPIRHVPPSNPGTQNVEHRLQHQPIIFGRSSSPAKCANLPDPYFTGRIRLIFLAASKAAPAIQVVLRSSIPNRPVSRDFVHLGFCKHALRFRTL
jgi:hypothetical protein